MLDTINRDCRTTLSVQVSKKLFEDIRQGVLLPGKRMPGVRILAQKFGISRGTVIAALDMLESKNYIERIPAQGTFVAEDGMHEISICRIVFPFPEITIAVDSLGSQENWGIVSEFYRGLMEEAANQNTEITFHHIEHTQNKLQLSRQMRRIANFDGGIFIGTQLPQLMEDMAAIKKPCIVLLPDGMETSNPDTAIVCEDMKDSFEQIVEHLFKRGYKKLRILSLKNYNTTTESTRNEELKVAEIAMIAENKLIETEIMDALPDLSDSTIDKVFTQLQPEFTGRHSAFFCLYTEIVPAVYKYAARMNLVIGENFGIFAHASGVTFSNLAPELTFSKINYFEMGKYACRMLANGIRRGDWKKTVKKMPNTLIIKQST